MMKSKKGAFSTLLAIVMTSIIVVLNILLSASNIRSRETLITSTIVSFQDLILSDFNSDLYERYGIFGTTVNNEYTESFMKTVYGFPKVTGYSASGNFELTGDILQKSISEFAKVRFPIFMAYDTYKRFTESSNIISENKNKYNTRKSKIKNEEEIFSDERNGNNTNYIEIVKILSKIDKESYTQSVNQDNFAFDNFDDFNNILDFSVDDNEFLFESQVVKDLKTDLAFSENTLNDISSFIDLIFDPVIPDFYEYIVFEHYIQKMFSCKTNFIIENGNKIHSENLRNYKIDNYNYTDKLEIEKIIFGYENSKTNEIMAAMSIRSIRTLLHIVSYIYDSGKNAQIKTTAAILCGLTAILSAGTVLVSTETMEIALIIILSSSMASKDYNDLTDGIGIKLFPMEFEYNIDTYYKDYLFLMQSMISREKKLNRMEEIIKTNMGLNSKSIYTGVRITCNFRNTNYISEGFYYENIKSIP